MRKSGWLFVLCSCLILSACGGKQDTAGDKLGDNKPKEPFSMSVYAAGVKPEEFDDRFRATLQKKFPHITFDYKTNTAGQSLNELVSQGNIPDLIRTDIPSLAGFLDLQLGEDLSPFVKKYNYNLQRFNKVFIDEIVDAGRTGALYGMPVPPFFPQVLYFNRDLFDRFGVPYPKDGMTWDETYEIAKRMTRVDGSQVYRGFSAGFGATLRDNPFSLPILDPSADQLADNGKWQALFNNLTRFYQIANNKIESTVALENTAFSKGNVAMQINQHNIYLIIPPEINWDIVTAPLMAGAPKLMGQRGPAYWAITKQSKHKDEAFQVIMEMLSDEVQMEDSKKGIPTVLVNKDIQNALGKSHAIYGSKNMKAISFYEPIPYTPKRKAGLPDVPGSTQTNLMSASFLDVALGKTDVNTALRVLDEKLKQEIAKEKAK